MGQYRGPFGQSISGPGSPWPLTGWRTDIGDLRIADFLGVHAMQAVPLLAWLAIKARWHRANGAVPLLTGVWTIVTILSMQLAVANQSLGRLVASELFVSGAAASG